MPVAILCILAYIQTYMWKHLIACLVLILLPLPSFPLLLFFCSTLCLGFMPVAYLFIYFKYTLFPLFSCSAISFLSFSSVCFCPKSAYNFFWCGFFFLTRAGWPNALLASQCTPRVCGLRSSCSCAPSFLRRKKKGIRELELLSFPFSLKGVLTWQFRLCMPAPNCSWCGWGDISQILGLRTKLGLMAIVLPPCTLGLVMLLPS